MVLEKSHVDINIVFRLQEICVTGVNPLSQKRMLVGDIWVAGCLGGCGLLWLSGQSTGRPLASVSYTHLTLPTIYSV